ncbi:MAG TPA: hypothetical protein VFJ76_00755 [Solirubrobacterales bacterium]|nr:hypothetical protein [Solirubrobacterales bacterium]
MAEIEHQVEDASAEQDGSPGEAESHEEQSETVLLRGPDLLTPEEGSRIAAAVDTRLAIWAGERDSGKTTLTAQLYERHRTGQANTVFAGSETLLGFEERIHPSRLESGRLTPRTIRTESDPEERELLHLAVRAEGDIENILLADIPGELFRRMRDYELEVSDVPLLTHADKLAVVVDGALIADHGLRSVAVNFARQFIAQLKNSNLPAEKMDVLLLLTKLDLVLSADASALSYWEEREDSLLSSLREFSPSAEALRTAARGLPSPDDGMNALMEWLLRPPPEPPESDVRVEEAPSTRIQRIRAPKTAP